MLPHVFSHLYSKGQSNYDDIVLQETTLVIVICIILSIVYVAKSSVCFFEYH